jgi:HEPN domain-containing protein
MLALADQYSSASETLSRKVANFGVASTLLSILSVEILLKCLFLLEFGERPLGHDYSKIWSRLPPECRCRLLEVGTSRFAGHVDFSNAEKILDDWSKAFQKGRYSYEANDDLTDEQVASKGEAWIAAGALIDQADFAYHPIELQALSFALREAVLQHFEA